MKYFLLVTGFILLLYIILLIPAEEEQSFSQGTVKPFIWARDSLWNSLEAEFFKANLQGCDSVTPGLRDLFNQSENLLNEISGSALNPDDYRFSKLEEILFKTAPLIPVCPSRFPGYISFYSRLRNVVKEQSIHWDMNSAAARNTIYRLLYGNRTAVEEIMLQLSEQDVPPVIMGKDEPSATPEAEILGVKIHSGDILVSRGGAPVSALIARGSDYPGNFSHIALVHIDKNSNVSIIESHIERGVTISSPEEYLKDTKLRIMVLRLRSDLIENNPQLPHQAAEYVLSKAVERHIPYDFAMNFYEEKYQFCSEVAAWGYQEYGIKLWKGISTISSKGTRNWLGAFGVKFFDTLGPTDLEYDPQLSVVAEWRDPQTLYKDHMDNAVTDVMLEEADSGRVLSYDWYLLPAGRIIKFYSWIINQFGGEGPIPEGMSTAAALKHQSYSDYHSRIKEKLISAADQFKVNSGYTPPYWQLVNLARQCRDE